MSYEKDKLDSYLTSASLSTALAPYITSASVSAAIAGLNLAPYMTSNSISAAVVTDALTVRGDAAVSATLSAGAVTIAGRPVGMVLLQYQVIGDATSIGFSGSWSDFGVLELEALYRVSGANTSAITLFTDGGTTPMLQFQPASAIATGTIALNCRVLGSDGLAVKHVTATWRPAGDGGTGGHTATVNSGVINCIRFSHSKTMSGGMAVLMGLRKT